MNPEICICAAVETADGYFIRGHRHADCFGTIQDEGKIPKMKGGSSQGFITSQNRFVTREEGYRLQILAGIESIAKGGYRGSRLFSEDLY